MHKNTPILVTVFILLLAVSGCASVSTVQRDAQGGTLALQGSDRKAMARAREQMSAHCGGRYEIVEERRIKAGEETNVDSEGGYEEDENTTTSDHGDHQHSDTHRGGGHEEHQTTTTSDVYEKWLTYRCLNS